MMKFYAADQYQPACERLFNQWRVAIQHQLPEARVEHIGASSIPSAISKGDLDIFVGVPALQHEEAVARLVELGFQEKQDTLRTSELCMLESKQDDDVALQVVANGSEFEDFLTFRDTLRANPQLVHTYNALKRACEGFEQDDYRERKARFVEQVLSSSAGL